MAAGCCGVKKQKLNAAVASVNSNRMMNGFSNAGKSPKAVAREPRVVSKEMCTYCFDVLHSYLHCEDAPKSPKFPNEKL